MVGFCSRPEAADMTDTFREITRNMQANEQHLRTNPADRGDVDDVPTTVVSVILVNYKGADDTIACLDALRSLDWPSDRLEVIDSGFGRITTVRHAAMMAETPPHWARPSVPRTPPPAPVPCGGMRVRPSQSHSEH